MDRVAAARQRLAAAKGELRSPAIGLPCVQCRYFELVCTHPAVVDVRANPVTGSVRVEARMSAAEARKEAGPCGPEGALFDERSLLGTAAVALLSTSAGRWSAGILSVLTLAYLFG